MLVGFLGRFFGSIGAANSTKWLEAFSTFPSLASDSYKLQSVLHSMLKSSSSTRDARTLHAVLLLSGFFHESSFDRFSCSQLVSLYVRLGNFHNALIVFEEIPQRSNVAWNALLRGFIANGRFVDAIELYHMMITGGDVPDSYTYPLVLKACSALGAIEEGRRVYLSIKHDMKHNVHVECALIDMFVKCGSVEEAHKVFDEMPRRDLPSYTAMICGSLQNKRYSEALNLFCRCRLDGFQPDYVIMTSLFSILGKLDALFLGLSLHAYAVKNDLVEDPCASNALIGMYCKHGRMEYAYTLFGALKFKDAISWNTIIAGYVQNQYYEMGLKIFVEMVRLGVGINAMTAASVVPALGNLGLLRQGKEMQSYAVKHGLGEDTVLGSAFIEMYAYCGLYRMAEMLFKTMHKRDIMVFNSTILACKYHGDLDRVFKTFREIWDSELKPNFITLVSVIPLCARLGMLTQGKEMHCYAIRTGMNSIVSVDNCVIDMYCKSGHLELAIKVFDGLLERSIVTYNSIIYAHGIHGRAELAFALFNQMKAVRIKPNRVTFVGLLVACIHKGLLKEGCYLFESMINDYGINPEVEHYYCLVDLLGRVGYVGVAYNFMKSMHLDLHPDMLGSILGSCRIHNKVELGENVGKEILCKSWVDSRHLVLLSNVYASDKRWDDARNVRTAMECSGFNKKPGCSWIQIGSKVHSFHATGTKHPEFDMIRDALENLFLAISIDSCISDFYLII